MEEYKTLSCVRGYHEYQRVHQSGWRARGMVAVAKNFDVKAQKGKATKFNGSLCCCSKEGWYHN